MRLWIQNANVYHSGSMRFFPGSVLAEGERIIGVYAQGDALPVLPEDRVVDAAGAYLIPGLVFLNAGMDLY